MDRKTFIKKTAGGLLLAVPAYALIGCSSSSDDSNPNNNPPTGGNPDCLTNGTNSSISGNHGHNITVSTADINAGIEKTYNIAGGAGHSHNVTVSVANFNTLKNNQQISVNSTSGSGHTHGVTVSCA
jgi:hypothetical protein